MRLRACSPPAPRSPVTSPLDSDLEVECNHDDLLTRGCPEGRTAGQVPITLVSLGGTVLAEVELDPDASVGQFKSRTLAALRLTDPGVSLAWFLLRSFTFGHRTYDMEDDFTPLLGSQPLSSLVSAWYLDPRQQIICTGSPGVEGGPPPIRLRIKSHGLRAPPPHSPPWDGDLRRRTGIFTLPTLCRLRSSHGPLLRLLLSEGANSYGGLGTESAHPAMFSLRPAGGLSLLPWYRLVHSLCAPRPAWKPQRNPRGHRARSD